MMLLLDHCFASPFDLMYPDFGPQSPPQDVKDDQQINLTCSARAIINIIIRYVSL